MSGATLNCSEILIGPVFWVEEACFAMRFGHRGRGGLGIARDVLTDMNSRLVMI